MAAKSHSEMQGPAGLEHGRCRAWGRGLVVGGGQTVWELVLHIKDWGSLS